MKSNRFIARDIFRGVEDEEDVDGDEDGQRFEDVICASRVSQSVKRYWR